MFGQDTRTWGPARIIVVQFIYWYGTVCLTIPLMNLSSGFLFPEDAVDLEPTTAFRIGASGLMTVVFVAYHYYQINRLKDRIPDDAPLRETSGQKVSDQG